MSSEGSARESRVRARIALAGTILVFVVIVTSAYLRLVQAGLGCADWPSCYGAGALARDVVAYNTSPLVPGIQAIHRIAATAVGGLVLTIVVLALQKPRRRTTTVISIVLTLVTLFLAVLGPATPGSKLPAVTLGNVLGGMVMLGIFWWLWLATTTPPRAGASRALALASTFGVGLLAAQIALGTLVSANYAALSCTTLPDCNGAWWPHGATLAAFDPFSPLSPTQADHPARGAVHMAHRYGALLVAGYLAVLGAYALAAGVLPRKIGVVVLALVLAQIVLGALAVRLSLPLALALAHHATAALLLLAVMHLGRSAQYR